jgi:hypothetical protein
VFKFFASSRDQIHQVSNSLTIRAIHQFSLMQEHSEVKLQLNGYGSFGTIVSAQSRLCGLALTKSPQAI